MLHETKIHLPTFRRPAPDCAVRGQRRGDPGKGSSVCRQVGVFCAVIVISIGVSEKVVGVEECGGKQVE